ncbi:MAG: peptide-methionine (S)-S-oxide reductase MsrA [Candidatus Omnitrophica bacterium]|nr:peptide-methionine (S)-S-oxide reductase MsrA [Candidatus Omnitrophota bacterium]
MKRIILCLMLMGCVMVNASAQGDAKNLKTAIFAGGCFWCMQPPYDKLPGVISTTVGYTGGAKPNPSYEEVSSGKTGHLEAVQVLYDSSKTSYRDLLKVFWLSIDPTDPRGQFADQGSQYETAIFYADEEQKRLAEESRQELAASGRFSKPIVTQILLARPFYPAEQYHQKYYQKNSLHYNLYRQGSGREGYLERVWK